MSSKETNERTVRLLSQTYRFNGPEIAEEWGRVLAGMTDAEVATATEYMREHYQSSYAPPFATFRAWGKGEASAVSSRRWWHTHDVIEIMDSKGRAHVLCEERQDSKGNAVLVPILVPRQERAVKGLPLAEYKRRCAALGVPSITTHRSAK